jgi:AcrR family transcriptional regulator
MATPTESGRQTRRPGTELRRLILNAARELFAANGYGDTTTRQVAQRAGVAEQSVFSHFGSKQGLYEAAVLEPFGAFVDAFTATWDDPVYEVAGLEAMTARYVEGLYDVVCANRDLFRALPADHVSHESTQSLFAVVERWVTPLVRANGYGFDPAIAVRSVFVLVTTMAVLKDDLLPTRSREEITAELTGTLLNGLTRKRD